VGRLAMAERGWALVTGAAGFLGRPLCALLQKEGYRVLAVDRREAVGPWDESRTVDLTDTAACGDLCRGMDVIFHLAAKTHAVTTSPHDVAAYRELNVAVTDCLVAAAVAAGVGAFVFMSSVKVLGEGSATALTDADPPRPASLYGETKLAAENLVHTAGREHGLHTCVLRAPLMYGPGVKGNLANMVDAIVAGRFPPLPETGNCRSLVDVRDVARALALVAAAPAARGRTFIVTDGRGYSSRRLQDLIRVALGRPPLSWSLPYPVFVGVARLGDLLQRLGVRFPFDSAACDKLLGSAVYDSAGIENELGFRPAHALDDTLSEMVP